MKDRVHLCPLYVPQNHLNSYKNDSLFLVDIDSDEMNFSQTPGNQN